jgi:hypothetical protein
MTVRILKTRIVIPSLPSGALRAKVMDIRSFRALTKFAPEVLNRRARNLSFCPENRKKYLSAGDD